mmetsp:Transcript_90730/g.157299  ORF Transcript_90730/g.157299 Transcript_90730/m.157299 type:complete len:208 (-) Transcript_90730:782-1405(-)
MVRLVVHVQQERPRQVADEHARILLPRGKPQHLLHSRVDEVRVHDPLETPLHGLQARVLPQPALGVKGEPSPRSADGAQPVDRDAGPVHVKVAEPSKGQQHVAGVQVVEVLRVHQGFQRVDEHAGHSTAGNAHRRSVCLCLLAHASGLAQGPDSGLGGQRRERAAKVLRVLQDVATALEAEPQVARHVQVGHHPKGAEALQGLRLNR